MTKTETLNRLNALIDEAIFKKNWKEFNRLVRLHKQLLED